MFEPSGPKILVLRSETLDRARLKGLPISSDVSAGILGDMPSGGVPAFAEVELIDCGVPAGESSFLR